MNYQLFHLINSQVTRWPWFDHVMQLSAVDLIFLVFAIAGAAVAYALIQRRIRAVVSLAATLVLAFGLSQVLAHISRERRPFQDHPVHQLIPHAGGVSMPSDHATAAFAIALGFLVFLSRRAGIALTAAAVLIGVARVWCGVHYPGDILAAAVIAALSTLTVYVVGLGPRAVETSEDASDPINRGHADQDSGLSDTDPQAAIHLDSLGRSTQRVPRPRRTDAAPSVST